MKGHAEVDWAGCYRLLIRRNAVDLMETIPGPSSALAVLHLGCGFAGRRYQRQAVMPFSHRCLGLSAHLLGPGGGQDSKLVPTVSLVQLDRCLNFSVCYKINPIPRIDGNL